MTKLNSNFVGLLAGIAAGLLAIASLSSGLASAPLIFLTPVAIYIASMGWGAIAGLIAAVAASLLCFLFGGVGVAFSTGLIIFAPAAWIGNLTNLGQADENGNTLWYPLSNILLQLMIVICIVCVIILFMVDFQSPQTTAQLAEILKAAAKNNPELTAPSDEDIANTLKMITSVMPIVAAGTWLAVHVANAYLAAVVVRSSGLMARTRDNIAETISLPKVALAVLAIGFAGTMFSSGLIAQISGVLLGGSITAFAFLGLADMHLKVRNSKGGSLILFAAYGSIFIFYLPILLFTGVGVMRLFRMVSQEANTNQPN